MREEISVSIESGGLSISKKLITRVFKSKRVLPSEDRSKPLTTLLVFLRKIF